MQFFAFDSAENKLRIDEYSILLVKEFKDLWNQDRNKCKQDKSGKLRLRAYRELTYIYLMLDFKSPYFQYSEGDKHESALLDSELTADELKDDLFIKAYNKYKEIQDSDPILSLIKTAHRTLYKTQVFLDNIDFNTDVDVDGRPLFKPKDVMDTIGSINKMRTNLIELETAHKSSLAAGESKVRGDIEIGWDEA